VSAEVFDRAGLNVVSAARPSPAGPVLSFACLVEGSALLTSEDVLELRDALDRWLADRDAYAAMSAPAPLMPPEPAVWGAVPVRTCQGCGCTDNHACAGGCSWASDSPDLCSRCVPQVAGVFGAYRIERTRPPSAIRYGRLAVDPVWFVVGPGELRERFLRKRDARAFVDTKIEEDKAAAESERAS
jgi:hypothetical protein